MEEPMSAITTPVINGQTLLQSCGFDRRLAASIIVSRPDEEQEELLATIVVDDQRRDVACAVWQIREALGLEADYAREISSGRQ
jgi:hypothetical protein